MAAAAAAAEIPEMMLNRMSCMDYHQKPAFWLVRLSFGLLMSWAEGFGQVGRAGGLRQASHNVVATGTTFISMECAFDWAAASQGRWLLLVG